MTQYHYQTQPQSNKSINIIKQINQSINASVNSMLNNVRSIYISYGLQCPLDQKIVYKAIMSLVAAIDIIDLPSHRIADRFTQQKHHYQPTIPKHEDSEMRFPNLDQHKSYIWSDDELSSDNNKKKNKKNLKPSLNFQTQLKISEWAKQKIQRGEYLSKRQICEKARSIQQKPNFKGTTGWLVGFFIRFPQVKKLVDGQVNPVRRSLQNKLKKIEGEYDGYNQQEQEQ